MATKLSPLKTSGTKEWHHLYADSPEELRKAADALGVDIHGKGYQEPHLDLTINQVVKWLAVVGVTLSISACIFWMAITPMP